MKIGRLIALAGLALLLAVPVLAEEEGAVTPAETTAVAAEAGLPTRRMMLDFFQAECMPLARAKKGFFSSENPLVAKCIDDVENFAATYAEEEDAAEAWSIAAALYQHRKDYPLEAVTLARILYLYPQSPVAEKAAVDLKMLATGELKEEGKALALLAKGPATAKGREERHLQLLRDIAGLQGKAFPPLQRFECNRFMRRFPDVAANEEALMLRDGSYQREKRYEAYASGVKTLITLYPASPARPQRLFSLGETLSRQLKQYDGALAPYREIYTAYPQAPEALLAYERAAAILAEELKKSPEAVILLKKVVEIYPRTDSARDALKYQAELQIKMKKPVEAIAAWTELADMFPASDHGVAALVAAALLARESLADYELQTRLQERIIKEYAEREEALQAKLDRAQTFEEKLNRRDAAIAGYDDLINNHAGHPVAEKARTRLDRLLKKPT